MKHKIVSTVLFWFEYGLKSTADIMHATHILTSGKRNEKEKKQKE